MGMKASRRTRTEWDPELKGVLSPSPTRPHPAPEALAGAILDPRPIRA
jgi:hypothetical protein